MYLTANRMTPLKCSAAVMSSRKMGTVNNRLPSPMVNGVQFK